MPKLYNSEWNDSIVVAVIDDEIQAYLSTNYEYTKFSKGVNKKVCKQLHKQYKAIFERYEN